MGAFLLKLLELSLQAGALILAILLIRAIFRKFPAKYLCVLWMIVAVRLIIPVSIESSMALMRSVESLFVEEKTQGTIVSRVDSVTETYEDGTVVQIYPATESEDVTEYYINGTGGSGLHIENGETDYYIPETIKGVDANQTSNRVFTLDVKKLLTPALPVLFVLWLLGMALLLSYGAFSCFKVKRLVKNAIPYEDNIWLCDGLESPFLFGWFHPQIYLPTNLEEAQMRYVILHEKTHIARGDNFTKLLGYALLSVYWFNPLIWVAYVMFCKDVERACDERVIDGLSAEERKGYAETLLKCSVDNKLVISNPLAFGETDVKRRITGVLKYKTPGKWLALIAVLLCVAAVAGCFFVQREDGNGSEVVAPTPTPLATATPILTPVAEPTAMPTIEPEVTETLAATVAPTPDAYTWIQTITHIPSDLERETNDLDLLGTFTDETLSVIPLDQNVTVDLNGDGVEEEISYDVWKLCINGNAVLQGNDDVFNDETPYRKAYYIFDIDVTDGYKEIGLRGMAPNGEVGIHLYRYDGEQVQNIGGFLSIQNYNREELDISVQGDGIIWTVNREFVFQTCHLVSKVQLENATAGLDAGLQWVCRDYYEFINWDWEGGIPITAAYEFMAFADESLDVENVVMVPEGSHVTFVDYYLPQREWDSGYVRFFYTVEEQWDSQGFLIISGDGVKLPQFVLPQNPEEPLETVAPDDLFHNLNHAG